MQLACRVGVELGTQGFEQRLRGPERFHRPLLVAPTPIGLTDEQADPNDLDAGSRGSTTPLANGMSANSLPVGQPLSQKLLADIQAAVTNVYRAAGYPFVSVTFPPLSLRSCTVP